MDIDFTCTCGETIQTDDINQWYIFQDVHDECILQMQIGSDDPQNQW